MCSGTVQWILRRDPAGLIHFCSIQSPLGRELYRQHGMDPDAPGSMLLLTPEGAFTRADAAFEVARLLGGIWRWLSLPARLLPHAARRWLYEFIASHRYQWFGRREACLIPQPEWRNRFVG